MQKTLNTTEHHGDRYGATQTIVSFLQREVAEQTQLPSILRTKSIFFSLSNWSQ